MSGCYDDGMAALETLEALRRQNRSLLEKLTKHNEKLTKHNEKLTKHNEKHNEKLTKHNEKLTKHNEKHNEKLTKHNEKLTKHNEKHEKHNEKLTKHNEKLTKHNEKHEKHNEKLQQLKISLPAQQLHTSATGPADRESQTPQNITTPDEKFAGDISVSDQRRVRCHLSLLLDAENRRWQNPTNRPEPLTPEPLTPEPLTPEPLTPDTKQIEDDSMTTLTSAMENDTASERRRIRPLLGYDWIAGLLDTESSVTERPEQFFSELSSFRQLNRDKCVHSSQSGSELVADVESSVLESKEPLQPPDKHQCIFCYRINTRLFAAPLDPHAACPVCKTPRNETEPAFIRVSIPRSALLPSYQHKAHRRSSFDPSDRLDLPSHCLSGWSSSSLDSGCQMNSLDLKGSLQKSTSSSSNHKPDSSLSKEWRHQRSDLLPNVSCLPRFHFQHSEQKMSEALY